MDWRRLLREPLVHFLLAGGILFGLSALFGQSFGVGGNSNRIEVTADRIQQLRETWTRQRGAPPTRRELDSLIEDFIREEVLYREAIASGLDQGDTIVRRRLAQKVEFLAQSVASTVEPSEAELQAFFDDNAERYRIPEQVGFSHVYFSGSNRGDAQRIVFVEPHGMVHAHAYEHDEKARLHERLPALAGAIAQRSPVRNVQLDSFIVSATPYETLSKSYGPGSWGRDDFAARHILFPEPNDSYDYIAKIIEPPTPGA